MACELRELMTPFRRAMRALGAASALVRDWGDDEGIVALSRALDAVPSCVAFHPFAATTQWTVDLAKPEEIAAPESARHGTREERVKRAALTRPSPASLLGAPPPRAEARPDGISRTQTRASLVSRKTGRMLPGVPLEPAATRERQVEAVFVRLRKLVEELESSTTEAVRASAAAPRANADNEPRSPGARPVWKPSAGHSTPVATEREATESVRAPGVVLLAEFVAAIWDRKASDARATRPVDTPVTHASEQLATAPRPLPAPRAASLLVPDLAVSPPRGAGPAKRNGPAADEQKERRGGSPTAPESEETLAERLNQMLIEQAWLRGVDLT